MTARCRGDDGSFAVEVSALTLITVTVLFCLGLFAWRISAASGAVNRAAQHGARAATLRESPTDAQADALASVRDNLAGVVCNDGAKVRVDTSPLGPGGTVTVTVTCRVNNRELAGIAVPGNQEFVATSTQIVDRWRSAP